MSGLSTAETIKATETQTKDHLTFANTARKMFTLGLLGERESGFDQQSKWKSVMDVVTFLLLHYNLAISF